MINNPSNKLLPQNFIKLVSLKINLHNYKQTKFSTKSRSASKNLSIISNTHSYNYQLPFIIILKLIVPNS